MKSPLLLPLAVSAVVALVHQRGQLQTERLLVKRLIAVNEEIAEHNTTLAEEIVRLKGILANALYSGVYLSEKLDSNGIQLTQVDVNVLNDPIANLDEEIRKRYHKMFEDVLDD